MWAFPVYLQVYKSNLGTFPVSRGMRNQADNVTQIVVETYEVYGKEYIFMGEVHFYL
jgi:hypothetical protein